MLTTNEILPLALVCSIQRLHRQIWKPGSKHGPAGKGRPRWNPWPGVVFYEKPGNWTTTSPLLQPPATASPTYLTLTNNSILSAYPHRLLPHSHLIYIPSAVIHHSKRQEELIHVYPSPFFSTIKLNRHVTPILHAFILDCPCTHHCVTTERAGRLTHRSCLWNRNRFSKWKHGLESRLCLNPLLLFVERCLCMCPCPQLCWYIFLCLAVLLGRVCGKVIQN